MDTGLARIPARSRQQAMDWSLVLASQDIEVTITRSQEDGSWGLLLAQPDLRRALDSIRQYQLENRGWPWQQAVSGRGVLFDWASLAWVALVALFYFLEGQRGFRSAGYMDTAAVTHGQWWRLFTAVWLHADVGHLASNAAFGFILLGFAMGVHGTGTGLLASYLAGAVGNVASWRLSSMPHISLGASGMVMGSLGLLTVQSFSWWRPTRHALRLILLGVFGGVMLFVLMGLSPEADVLAHLGGFVSGVALGIPLSLAAATARKSWINLGSGLAFAVLVILPWWLALSHAARP